MLNWLWKLYGGGLAEEEEATITPNSMSPLPPNKFNNLARIKAEVDEDIEPYDNIYHYHRIQRLMRKNKRIKEIIDEENFIDKNYNWNGWFYNRYKEK
tara:strand:- start:4472 stop:4765 length:294 start_codon:yes stop_codon:yes gene_type:complete